MPNRVKWFTLCKIAFHLETCSAVQAEIKGCELLLRTLNEIVKHGTLDCSSVEKAVRKTEKLD